MLSVRWPIVLVLGVVVALPLTARGAPDLRAADAAARAAAARQAGQANHQAAIPRLIELLRDEAWQVREAAARALGLLRARDGKRPLMVLAQTDGRREVRQAAAEAVRRIDPAGFVAVLATSDPPPVIPATPAPEAPAPAPGARLLLAKAVAVNGLRFTDSVSGQLATGLRFRHVDLQLTLNYPSLALALQVRWSILPDSWVVPLLTAGAARRGARPRPCSAARACASARRAAGCTATPRCCFRGPSTSRGWPTRPAS